MDGHRKDCIELVNEDAELQMLYLFSVSSTLLDSYPEK